MQVRLFPHGYRWKLLDHRILLLEQRLQKNRSGHPLIHERTEAWGSWFDNIGIILRHEQDSMFLYIYTLCNLSTFYRKKYKGRDVQIGFVACLGSLSKKWKSWTENQNLLTLCSSPDHWSSACGNDVPGLRDVHCMRGRYPARHKNGGSLSKCKGSCSAASVECCRKPC